MHILIAPNAFKNALSADAAATAIQRGLSRSRLSHSSECFPVGDGGDNTGDLLIQRFHGQRLPCKARDPLGRIIETFFGFVPPGTAIIEMANASGIRLLTPATRDPLHTTSAGAGDLIRAALDHGVYDIILCMGGSATVDGGTGILQALGVRFLNSNGQPLQALPLELPDLASIDLTNLDPRLAATNIVVLCDVVNPLTGPHGAAAVFGPQKGANPSAVRQLESSLQSLSQVILRQTGIDLSDMPRAGTAGGGAAGLHALLHATLVSGIDYFLEITAFDKSLSRSTHVITGEGSIDEQTLQGKAPFGVATHAIASGLPVIALTGRMPDNPAPLNPYFDEIISINPPHARLRKALAETAVNLERTAMEWANRLAATT
jgi:glycerate kinase